MTLWEKVNLNLIAKSIGELAYEEILTPICVNPDSNDLWKKYKLLLKNKTTYFFNGWIGIWGNLNVNPLSLKKDSDLSFSAPQFFIDIQSETKMTDLTLSKFLEELSSTLYSDMIIERKLNSISSQDVVDKSFLEQQPFLNGHPKILLNKGRMGWSVNDIDTYAPESQKAFQLNWVFIKKTLCKSYFFDDESYLNLIKESLNESEFNFCSEKLESLNLKPLEYFLVPIHPWQWDQIIQFYFIEEINKNELINIGLLGESYQPQISIRSLSNKKNPNLSDLKLPLMILNTSAVRGINSEQINKSPLASKEIEKIAKNDNILSKKLFILKDLGGIGLSNKYYSQIAKSPYKYHEIFGAVWRESVDSKLKDNESAIMTGALWFKDTQGNLLISEVIKKSRIEVSEWLKLYFESVLIPLYHLQLEYGIGIVSHGQNIVLKLKNNIPTGIFIKDFQGDIRRAKDHDFKNEKLEYLSSLPNNYLIHDLFTGHFLTVLRFVSACMHENNIINEDAFYKIASEVINNYSDQYKKIDQIIDLRRSKFEKVLLNKVRFEVGYEEGTERLKPFLGTDLINPLNNKSEFNNANL